MKSKQMSVITKMNIHLDELIDLANDSLKKGGLISENSQLVAIQISINNLRANINGIAESDFKEDLR